MAVDPALVRSLRDNRESPYDLEQQASGHGRHRIPRSGKTKLLARILQNPALANTAVLVNELGEIDLDHHLLEHVDETTLLLDNGCICCTRRGELADALRDLLKRESRSLGRDPARRASRRRAG